ncbi:MAG: hypothetical protein A3F84_29440 [Candidatus Handelsmanbacteria bacterium RIFCSPLOWO2_12_FULL_64_10]|uniref:Type IV conjugative transfer system protein TraE n=1 Tax=Handelsmanbacteria sp. (strain RIFCSPLOWO2_12_FULL_64_10) TaxID=1817868 RepID=A0A1F6CBU1_HANXR|nr:MAG: hypothetical protein A3F84_29440 [Candidatus Handelsmanbacteria bacterium RIFCSPLOWO2_12_FULL_64_10]
MPLRWRLVLSRRILAEHVLWIAIIVLVALALVLAGMYRQALMQVFYVPSADRLSVARAEAFDVPPHQVAHFAEHFVTNYEGFTPESAGAQTQYLKLIMSEGMLARQPQVLERLRRYSQEAKIRSQVQIVPGTTEVTEQRNRWIVRMQLVKYEYTRGELWRPLLVESEVTVITGVISEVTPDGLLIEDYHQTSAPLSEVQR